MTQREKAERLAAICDIQRHLLAELDTQVETLLCALRRIHTEVMADEPQPNGRIDLNLARRHDRALNEICLILAPVIGPDGLARPSFKGEPK